METTSEAANPDALLPLTEPMPNILLSLENEERCGFEILRDIGARTGGRVRLSSSTTYAAPKKALEKGFVEVSKRNSPRPWLLDYRRRYYTATPFGRWVPKAEISRMEAYVKLWRG